ncbi:MAG: S9 family peptidase [Proteobacteria bacterium]|nr:S9 family peptidase [Pseudomonadota bacterium]
MKKSANAAGAPTEAGRLLTIAQIASAPFPYDLTASPRDGTVAWVYNERGARNIWIARAGRSGTYSARRLTRYTEDDGNTISGLAWSGDGQTLFYTRGGVWWNGELPVNPRSLPEGSRGGAVWAVPVTGGSPRRIGEGWAPAPSPKGDAVVFLRGGHPWLARANGRTKAAPLFVDRGKVGALTWSPDGRRLAFVSARAEHQIVGVYDLAAKSIRWICPGIDQDLYPTWSPDGKRIAFIRSVSEPEVPFTCRRECTPWEIRVADAATGRSRAIWRANDGVGSCFRLLFNSRSSLFWGADDKLVFPWEGTGWVRLYGIPAEGGSVEFLTPGESEVFGAALSADRTRLVYSSNEGDLDRRHIWELSLPNGRPRQLTFGDGIEDLPVIGMRGRTFALRGEARVPLRPVEITEGGMTDLAPRAIPADFPSADLVVPRLVTFQAADGLVMHGQLFVPQGRPEKRPAVLFFHGGPTERQMFAAWDPFETHSHLYESCQYLANHGYEVLSVNYRGGAGYGFEYREPPGFGAGGASELKDIIAAAKYMHARPTVDPKRLGVWGGSYGGRMTLLALAAAPEYFAAGVSYAGIYDWLTMPEFKSRRAAIDPAAAQLAHESGAVAYMNGWRAPVLLMLGAADSIVEVNQTTALAARLRKQGIPLETLVIPDEVHFLLRASSWAEVFTTAREYFDRRLK